MKHLGIQLTSFIGIFAISLVSLLIGVTIGTQVGNNNAPTASLTVPAPGFEGLVDEMIVKNDNIELTEEIEIYTSGVTMNFPSGTKVNESIYIINGEHYRLSYGFKPFKMNSDEEIDPRDTASEVILLPQGYELLIKRNFDSNSKISSLMVLNITDLPYLTIFKTDNPSSADRKSFNDKEAELWQKIISTAQPLNEDDQ